MSTTLRVIDKAWAERVLVKLGRAPSGQKNKRSQNELARAASGYAWHEMAKPENSLVGARIKTDASGVITTMDIAGRPAGKHGGKQGQHSTAFGANREVILAATIGRTEEQARSEVAYIFGILATYPAFTDKTQPAPDADLLSILTELADANSGLSKSYSLSELSSLYLEIRDALPGASLDTGISGKAAKSSRNNIVGKGEGTSLAELRSMEEHAIEHEDEDLDDEDEEVAVRCMYELYDSTAEESAAMSDADARAQQLTFLKTIAQAFPQTFLSAGGSLAQKLSKLTPADAKAMMAACKRLADNNKDGMRPQPKNFIARLSREGIEFIGRSDSVKDAGTMGDHTCAEQLMKNSATSLLRPNGKETTNDSLIGGLQTISNQFQCNFYEEFHQEIDPSFPAHMVTVRYDMLVQHHAELDKLLKRLEKLASNDLAHDADIMEAAELYMQLVDDRPTAVNYDAPARGHGESLALSSLEDIEDAISGGTYDGDRAGVLDAAFGLLDCKAAYNTAFMMYEHAQDTSSDPDEVFDTCIARVAEEFLFFFENAYPFAHEAALLEEDADDLAEDVRKMIFEKGQAGTADDDGEYDDDDDGAPRRKRRKVASKPVLKARPRKRSRNNPKGK